MSKLNAENALLLELPGNGGGTVVLGRGRGQVRIHHGLQIGNLLLVERAGKKGYEAVAPASDHELAVAFQTACDRSERHRLMTKPEQRAWTRAADSIPTAPTEEPAKIRRPKKGEEPHTDEERALMAKWEGLRIKPGSLHYDEKSKKKRLTILCVGCGQERSILSSDAFQVRYGATCNC